MLRPTDRLKFRYVWKRKSDGHISTRTYTIFEVESGQGVAFHRMIAGTYDLIARDQFTGWNDTDSDVYENDVVDVAMIDGFERGVIVWDDERGQFAFKSLDGGLYGLNQEEVARQVIVIGSIHEHPDLLTQEGNDG